MTCGCQEMGTPEDETVLWCSENPVFRTLDYGEADLPGPMKWGNVWDPEDGIGANKDGARTRAALLVKEKADDALSVELFRDAAKERRSTQKKLFSRCAALCQ
jgi:hypothetical protein